MLFSSGTFGVFLVIVLFVYWLGPVGSRLWMLLAASYIFYMWNNPWFIFLIVGLSLVNFYAAALITRSGSRRKWLLVATLCVDLLSIGFFKYANFLITTSNYVARHSGLFRRLPLADIYLPLGISFFTFQMMSYLIDVYKGKEREKRLRDFALYIAFFPQLVAGPIMRSEDLIPQFHSPRQFNPKMFREGIFFVAMGLLKKVVFADNLGAYATRVFDDPGGFNTASTLVGLYAYAFQIYFDFSGYSDIAIGCGRMMGFQIITNFNLPYLAADIRDFWRRWHISLSTWLRDYLYIPLGGSKNGRFNTYRNLFITMLLGGLWHGAAWKFVLWGGFHGVLLAGNRFKNRILPGSEANARLYSIRWLAGWFVTFHLVCIGWVFFRSNSPHSAGVMFSRLGALDFGGQFEGTYALAGVALGLISHLVNGRWSVREAFLKLPGVAQAAVYAIVALLLAFFSTSEQPFIYFQF